MRLHYILIIVIQLVAGTFFSQKINRLNKHGERHGVWITYNDKEKNSISIKGRYRNGRQVGSFYFYDPDGHLERIEKNRFKKIHTTTYYSNGKKRSKGKAKIQISAEKIHYFFYGKWRYYDTNGIAEKYVYYETGKIIKTVYIDKNNCTNDSLMYALNSIDTYFNQTNAELLDSISHSAFNIPKRERLQNELFMSDTLSFNAIQSILKTYGYPKKKQVHESAAIPFYIISFAPSGIRENYLELFKTAANNGDIEWKSLTFYIDKLYLALGKKQVYGTQYYYLGRDQVYYPIEDYDHLPNRLKEIGLD